MTLLGRKKRGPSKKPFIRQDLHKVKVKPAWRKPKGIHSKLKMKKRGYQRVVSIGYGTKKQYAMEVAGRLQVRKISNVQQLSSCDPKHDAVEVAHGVGARKKLAILKEAQQKQFTVINIEPQAAIALIEGSIRSRKEHQKESKEKAQQKEKEASDKKKEELEKKITEEEKREKDIKEAEKVLIKRQ
ncbi:hypothetical protein HYU14_03970 [Candidatus Woesearchaeota archaeon]|nr:hypothetical protein [Candidatus Woesearchaeota archaeon]